MMKEKNLYPDPSMIWSLYHLLADYGFFSIEFLSEQNGALLDKIQFSKKDAREREMGEKRLFGILGKYTMDGYRKVECDFAWGFGYDLHIRVFV